MYVCVDEGGLSLPYGLVWYSLLGCCYLLPLCLDTLIIYTGVAMSWSVVCECVCRTRMLDGWTKDLLSSYQYMNDKERSLVRTFLNLDLSLSKDIYLQDKLANGMVEAPRAATSGIAASGGVKPISSGKSVSGNKSECGSRDDSASQVRPCVCMYSPPHPIPPISSLLCVSFGACGNRCPVCLLWCLGVVDHRLDEEAAWEPPRRPPRNVELATRLRLPQLAVSVHSRPPLPVKS